MDKLTQLVASSHPGFSISHGARRSDCLSLDFGWSPREKWITINDFLEIASLGYDKVRLPVEENVLWKSDGTRDEEAFTAVDRIVSHARAAGLQVTVDVSSRSSLWDETVWRTKTDLKSIFGKGESVEVQQKASYDLFGFKAVMRAFHAFA
jgi:aryl-phospho-beta-D-glucosidase BglC (GH1 family)